MNPIFSVLVAYHKTGYNLFVWRFDPTGKNNVKQHYHPSYKWAKRFIKMAESKSIPDLTSTTFLDNGISVHYYLDLDL